jgi:hypothetical protein
MPYFNEINIFVVLITFIGIIWATLRFILTPFRKIVIKIYNLIIINYYSKKKLRIYSVNKSIEFIKNTEIPYNLKEDVFVNNFDLIDYENTHDNKLIYFYNLLQKKVPLFLIANYGMGKSTISKFLFIYIHEKTNKFPIFINLHLKKLKNYYIEKKENEIYYNKLTNEIFKEIFQQYNLKTFFKVDSKKIIDKYRQMLFEGKIILILDGLDEVNISSYELDDKIALKRSELDTFIKIIFEQNYSILLTCRKEYVPFTISYENYNNNNHNKIELAEWGVKQWNAYFEQLASSNLLTDTLQFQKDIVNKNYGDLPKRPLFLTMLTELIIFNNNEFSKINDKLKTNLAEIYNKYIDFNLNNDFNNKSQELSLSIINIEDFKKVWKILLVELASEEYKTNTQLSLKDIISIATKLDNKEKYYSKEWIEKTLSSSALFAIIHREKDSDIFYFSHKSFLEYLVAFKLVEGFFHASIDSAYCSDMWTIYQTHEVHQHLLEEIIRVAFYCKVINTENDGKLTFNNLYNNNYLESAFTKVINKYIAKQKLDNFALLKYYEDYEEVLYYIGKFKIKKLKKNLIEILENKTLYNSIYYRSVSLALSSIEDNTIYCDKYIINIANNYLNKCNEDLFNENDKIQKKYYGSVPSIMREKLHPYINKFLNNNEITTILSLIVFTYYTAFKPIDKKEELLFEKDLNKLKTKALNSNLISLYVICNLIPIIWKKLSKKTEERTGNPSALK